MLPTCSAISTACVPSYAQASGADDPQDILNMVKRADFYTRLNEPVRTGSDGIADRIMDLHNNKVGQTLAMELLEAGVRDPRIFAREATTRLYIAATKKGALVAGSSLWVQDKRDCIVARSSRTRVRGVIRGCR